MNKKPAVVAKTAKKRGRPAGTRNKPKVEVPAKVDWEKLAKQLQVALSAEIKDNDGKQALITLLQNELDRNRTFSERLVCLVTGAV